MLTDEVDNFISALQFFKQHVAGAAESKHKAIKFKSRAGFECSCIVREGKQGMHISFDARGYDRCGGQSHLDERYMDTLLQYLQQAKEGFVV